MSAQQGLATGFGEHISPSADGTMSRADLRRHLSARWFYSVAAALAALASAAWLQSVSPSPEPAYAPVGAALLVGALLRFRLRPGVAGVSLLVVPAIIAEARFGAAALLSIAFAQLVADLARGGRGPAVLAATAHTALAYSGAHLAAQTATQEAALGLVVFAVAFTLVRFGLGWLGRRADALSFTDPRQERPDVVLPLLLAPLAGLPLLAGVQAGDGALLLSLAALLALLFVVREAANLATARAEAEAERDRLARAKELQEELLHLITHEVKNPLTSVLATTELSMRALARQNTDKLPQYLAVVERGGRAIQRLVDNLLQLSSIEQETDLPASESIELSALIGDVLDDLRPLAEHKQQALTLDVAPETPPVLAPPLLLREALSNLVSNAVKYTPESGRIRVWARAGDVPGIVLLGVTDTGIGLSQEELTRLFTKFFRSADPRARRERGSGLGLALTHSIVRRMGGRIAVESQVDKGTTFSLWMPAASA